METQTRRARMHGPRARRGLTTIASVILVVVVLALVGVATYGIMGGFASSGPGQTCQPANSFICGQFINLHDVKVLIPFKSVQQGTVVPFTISLPPSESPTNYKVNFGDGSPVASGTSSTISHNFSEPGTYLIQSQATINGLVHDNLPSIVLITVTPSFGATSAGSLPTIAGSILSNSTAPVGTKGVTAVLQVGQKLQVSGTYTAAPTNSLFTPIKPSFVASTGANLNATVGPSSGTANVTFPTAGTYTVTFVGSATNGNETVFQNYTWSVVVAPVGSHAGIVGSVALKTPHPGTIIVYELVPGGAASEDPAIDYETAGAEPIINVYETLIAYNGSDTGPDPVDFMPELATCVPGSAQCANLYGGDTLVDSTYTNYTFAINPNAAFYDPSTQASWGVYPTDVVFSLARTMGFSTLPCVSCNNGWILTQALLNSGNVSWDSNHGAFNNTPQNILNSMTINQTGACPAAAMDPSTGHGCVTFHVNGNHHIWPYFLELIGDALGGSIVPCGWFSAPAQGAGIPYWTQGNVSGSGDHPCGAPGTAGWGPAVTNIPYRGWDQWELAGSGSFGTYQGHVQWGMVGSGPYYMEQYSVGTAFTLKANPAYVQNQYCTWTGCLPAKGSYATNVEVTWETTATPGEQAYAAGVADAASIPEPDLSLLIQLIDSGQVNAVSAPTLTIGFHPFNLNFNLASAQKFTTNPITVKTDWFSYLGMRQFFDRAYPYATVENTINTRDGIQFSFNYGGAIPQFMANYYPNNIPWPNTDPCTDATNVACPTYWWDQMLNPTSQFYDPEVVSCTPSNPCQLPMFGTTGAAANDEVMALWSSEISTLTNGAVKVSPVDINFIDVVTNSGSTGPGLNPMPLFSLGWAPDYPDPTDYVAPLYAANGTYTYGDSVAETLLTPQYTNGCPGSVTDYNYFANTTFGNNCQGEAYKAMLYAMGIAANTPAGPYRVLLYDVAEKIAYQLALYIYSGQSNLVASFAAWMDTSSIDTNVTIGGGGDTPFFWLTGTGVQYAGST